MIYDLKEIVLGLFEIYNNLTGVCIAIVALVIGLALCRFTNLKVVIVSICVCFFLLTLGVLATLLGDTPDNLWMPIIFFPAFIVLVTVCAVYYTLKSIIRMLKK